MLGYGAVVQEIFLKYELDLCSIYDRLKAESAVYRFYILMIKYVRRACLPKG